MGGSKGYVTRYAAGAVILLGLGWIFSDMATPRDDTDPPGGRSGMMLLTDHGTGCQYLYRGGAMVPRMDKSGKQVCRGSAM